MDRFLIFLLIFFIIPSLAFSINERDIIENEEGNTEYRSERVAVIVGVEKYLDRNISDLDFSVDDANLIKNVLETQGNFTIEYITDESENRSPTKENILGSLDEIIENQKIGMKFKTLIFYFGGHGFNVDGENYIAPTETDPRDIKGTAISLNEVLERLNIIQNNDTKVMLFLDACRNDPTQAGKKGTENDYWGDNDSRGLKIMYSTSIGDYSYELDGHGIFTLYLVGALLGAADQRVYNSNEDNFVTFAEASRYVTMKMKEWSLKTGYKQSPRIEYQEAMGDFIISVVDDAAFQPQSFMKNPEIEKIDVEGVSIEWETDKETIDTLYLSEKEDFEDEATKKTIYDKSIDGMNHKAVISYDIIDPKNGYYYKVESKDFLNNILESEVYYIKENEIYDTIHNNYNIEFNKSIAVIKIYTKDGDYQTAVQTFNDIFNLIDKYNEALNLEEIKLQFTNTYEALNKLVEGDQNIDTSDYEEALVLYNDALTTIIDAGTDKYIKKEPIESKIRKLKIIVEAFKLVNEGDNFYSEENYKMASIKYNNAIELIKKENVDDIVSIYDIEQKIEQLPENLSKTALNIDFGIYTNLIKSAGEESSALAYALPIWNLSFLYRFNKHFSIGLGLHLFNIDVHAVYSFINTYGHEKSSELYIKAGLIMPVIFNSIGIKISAGYTIGLGSVIGINFKIGMWTQYNFNYNYTPLNIYFISGVVIFL